MSDAVVAHLYVAELNKSAYQPDGCTVVLRAATQGEHNKQWAQATPSAEFKLSIKNPIAAQFFEKALGDEFEVIIRPLPKPESSDATT